MYVCVVTPANRRRSIITYKIKSISRIEFSERVSAVFLELNENIFKKKGQSCWGITQRRLYMYI